MTTHYYSLPILGSEVSLTREAQLREALTELGLSQTHLNTVQLPGAWQPYHNWGHCVIVALKVLEAGRFVSMSEHDLRLLVLAALYHDFSHTGSPKKSDVFNIVRAVSGMSEWVKLKEAWATQADVNEIAELIYATEARHHVTKLSQKEEILVDADVFATDVEDREAWFSALAEETGQRIDTESSWIFIRTTDAHSFWGQHARLDYLGRLEEQLHPEKVQRLKDKH